VPPAAEPLRLERSVSTRVGTREILRVRLCGAAGTQALVRVRETLSRAGRVRAAATSTRSVGLVEGCAWYRLSWRLAPRLAALGSYAVRVDVRAA
jgi:hypothetical protein